MFVCFTAGNYLYHRYLVKSRETEASEWIKNTAPKLYTRQVAQIRLIKEKALEHQGILKGKLEILAAFYGSKLAIQVFVEEKRIKASQ